MMLFLGGTEVGLPNLRKVTVKFSLPTMGIVTLCPRIKSERFQMMTN